MKIYDEPADEETRKKAEAEEIYAYLQSQIGRAAISGFGNGVVISENGNRTIHVELDAATDDFLHEDFLKRGFGKEEIAGGIIVLIEVEPPRSYKNVAIATDGSVHAEQSREDRSFTPTELSKDEIDAIGTIAKLSAIPGRIYDRFGSFNGFRDLIPNFDLDGISRINYEGHRILFNGGLEGYVDGIELMRAGQMDMWDSSRRAVMGRVTNTTDRSSYFEGIVSKVIAVNRRRAQ